MGLSNMEFDTPQSEIFAAPLLTSSNNLNDIKDFGLYAWALRNRPTNAPDTSGSGGMLVMRISSSGVVQFVVNDQNIYYRTWFSSSGWTSWKKLTGSTIS